MATENKNIRGLTDEEVTEARDKFGTNQLTYEKENAFLNVVKKLAKEPMLVLLLAASSIYFISGDIGDGIFLTASIVLVSAISLYQEKRSRNALDKLKNLTQPKCRVIRNGETKDINSLDLVVGDSLVIEEGASISADGIIVQSNDFSVNESILTGESMAAEKNNAGEDNTVFTGSTVVSGLAIVSVTAIGNTTRLGKIGNSLQGIKEEATPLELQVNNFVRMMVVAGAVVFIIVWGINYSRSSNLLDSLLKALTLAMSILPEEIPVAFATFMALGAWRLMKLGIVVKQMKTVETLGSATVICTDKTGTITENRMSLVKLFVLSSNKVFNASEVVNSEAKELVRLAMFASEPIPFDPMEKALHDAYATAYKADERAAYKMIHEYPLAGKPPMMTHVFEDGSGKRVVAAKGAPEALINVSGLSTEKKQQIEIVMASLSAEGYRLLAVGEAAFNGDAFPETQQQFSFTLKGIVAFYDPPKENIPLVLENFYKAGIAVKIITGDNAATTMSIARQVGFKGCDKSITGDELMKLTDVELQQQVMDINLFTRMFPDAKLRIINALKSNSQIVAMTGDGVNDGPALKAAHIGIAMGKKGTEIAKQAASLILVEDDLSKMVDAVAMGRRIYANLKKAIQYIISIHIPIVLTVFIPLALGWKYPNIFTPVHIIFLELIMGPTCSIIYENEPMEDNTMLQKPRPFTTSFFNFKELLTSLIQGAMITAGTLIAYQYAVRNGLNEGLTRTMVFIVLIAANIFLTLVNRSFYYSIFTTVRYKNNLVLLIISITIIITSLLLFVKPLAVFFGLETLNSFQFATSIGIGFLSVIWFEVVKLFTRDTTKGNS